MSTSHGIKKSVLLALLGDGMAWSRPGNFGAAMQYKSEERARRAGSSLGELATYGLGLQSEIHDRYNQVGKDNSPEEAARLRKSYQDQHNGLQVDYRVNMKSSPSGLRPLTIPNKVNKDQFQAWYGSLLSNINTTANDDDIVAIPGFGTQQGGSGIVPSATGEASAPKTVKGNADFNKFSFRWRSVQENIDFVLTSFANSEDPASLSEKRELLVAWKKDMPDFTDVSPSFFDKTILRVGSEVELIPGAPIAGFIQHLASTNGVEVPRTFTLGAVDFTAGTCDLLSEVLPRKVVAKTGFVRRVIKIAPEATNAANWKPEVYQPAYREGSGKVYVVEISSLGVLVSDSTGDEFLCPATELSAPRD